MSRDVALLLGVVLVPLTVAAAVAYWVLWRWLAAAPDRQRWLGLWVVAHGLAVASLILLRFLAPGQAAGSPTSLAWADLAGRLSPPLAGLALLAALLAASFLWLVVLALIDGLYRLLAPVRPPAADAETRNDLEAVA